MLAVPAVAVLLLAGAAGAGSTTRSFAPAPSFLMARIGVGDEPIADSALSASDARGLLADRDRYWGGSVTAASGDMLSVFFSDDFAVDTVLQHQWADFFATLLHGPELANLTAYILTQRQIESLCGSGSLACYSARSSILVAPAQTTDGEPSAEAVAIHEYGHHVAANRNNAPWVAVNWGTKRWASAEQVCTRTARGELFPGAEEDRRYTLNPGEGFAESYRVLNERRLGRTETPWDIVDQSLYPTDAALSALAQDVTNPWNGNRSSTLAGRFGTRGTSRTFTIATPVDGRLSLRLRAARGERLRLSLSADGNRVARTTTASQATVNRTVCGARSYRATVSRLAGSGRYTLAVSRP